MLGAFSLLGHLVYMTDSVHKATGCRCAARVAVACLSLVMISGCAVKQSLTDDPRDPWEGYNRHVFALNESVDVVVLKPVVSAYQKVLPEFVQISIANVFSNLEDVTSALNNLLQGDVAGSGGNAARFLVNSTLGVFGLFDPAASFGLFKEEEDFGQTLAVWGVGSGPYFVLPLFGPSTLRDFPGKIVDLLIYPVNWIGDNGVRSSLQVTKIVSNREGFIGEEAVLREMSPDFYQQVRGFYLNQRKHRITDGHAAVEDSMYEEILE